MKRAIGKQKGGTWHCYGCQTVYVLNPDGTGTCEKCGTFYESSIAILVTIERRLANIERKLGITDGEAAPGTPKRCRARWVAGIAPGLDAPPHGARCTKHEGHHLIEGADKEHVFQS